MPGPVNNNSRVLANRIVDEAKAKGVTPEMMQNLGKALMESFNQTNINVSYLPAIREHAETLANALVMATNELAANTAPDPFVDGGVTA